MTLPRRIVFTAVLAALSWGGTEIVHADEGMWVFNNLPLKQLKETYGFEPTPGWVEHLRSSAVRFNSGGSGSFVSADGLVMTNHHVGADTLQKISTPEKDYYKTGFHAKTHAEEVKAPDLELNVLVGIEDVTDRVLAAVKPGMDDAAAGIAKRGAMATIEKESLEKTGLRSDVVTLYQGGQYHLYTFKKYTDVRLVFAPEFDIAFFGGDPDNFEYPRYDLDVCFFRAYEDGKPARPKHYLKWSPSGSKDGELIFVAGHPGRTSRLNTLAHLEYLRDVSFPFSLAVAPRPRGVPARLRQARAPSRPGSRRKTCSATRTRGRPATGGLEGLRDKALMARKAEAEQALRERGPGRPAEAGRLRRGLGQDRRGAEGLGADQQAVQLPRTRLRLRLAPVRRSPAPSSGSPRKRGSPTPTGSANTATRRSIRSSSNSSPTPPSIPSTRRPSSPTRSPSGSGRWGPTTRWSSASCAGGPPSRPPRTWSTAPSSPTSRSARSSPREGLTAIEASRRPDDQAAPWPSTPTPAPSARRSRTRSRAS